MALVLPFERTTATLNTETVRPQRAGTAAIPALTGLRIIAALLVFWHHLPVSSSVELPGVLINFKEASFIGVILFFTLSGFILTYTYYHVFAESPWRGLWRYTVHRFARIYPLLLCIVVLSMATTGFSTPLRRNIWTIVQHLTVTWVWNGDIHLAVERAYGADVQAWSLGVEFFLYALLPFLVWALSRHCTTLLRGLAVAVVVIGADAAYAQVVAVLVHGDYWAETYWLYRFPIPHMAEFTVGSLTALAYMRYSSTVPSQRENAWGMLGLLLSCGMVIGLMVSRDQTTQPSPYLWSVAYMLPFAGLLFGLARYRTPAQRLLSTPVCVLLGEASYAFYLLHLYYLSTTGITIGSVRDDVAVLLGLGLLLCSALGVYTYLETPARHFLRKALT